MQVIGSCESCGTLGKRVKALGMLVEPVCLTAQPLADSIDKHFAPKSNTNMLRSLGSDYPTCAVLPWRACGTLKNLLKHTGILSTSVDGMSQLQESAPLVCSLIESGTDSWMQPVPDDLRKLLELVRQSALEPFSRPTGTSDPVRFTHHAGMRGAEALLWL